MRANLGHAPGRRAVQELRLVARVLVKGQVALHDDPVRLVLVHARVAQKAVDAAKEPRGAEGHPEDVVQEPDEHDHAQDGHGHRRLLLRDGYPCFFAVGASSLIFCSVSGATRGIRGE